MSSAAYREIVELADKLAPDERLELIAHLAVGVCGGSPEDNRPSRLDLLGAVPYPALGDDAQAWVSRTRHESDDGREAQWRGRE